MHSSMKRTFKAAAPGLLFLALGSALAPLAHAGCADFQPAKGGQLANPGIVLWRTVAGSGLRWRGLVATRRHCRHVAFHDDRSGPEWHDHRDRRRLQPVALQTVPKS